MSITTRKKYPFRDFYKGKERLALYVVNVLGGEPSISVYSDYVTKKIGADSLRFTKKQLEEEEFKVYDFLRQYFPEALADAIFKYAKKDLGCKTGFSLKSYISWKTSRH